MLYDPQRHERLESIAWDEARARAMIERIVADTEARFSTDTYWPMHPRDADDGGMVPAYPLYYGACGVMWALRYLRGVGAIHGARAYDVAALLPLDRAWLASSGFSEPGSYLMGETSILMLMYWDEPSPAIAQRIEDLIASNFSNPTRELMWGAPGTMLAALFMHERVMHERGGESRWSDLFRRSARTLWSQLLWSPEYECHYWTQDLYGQRSSYIDAVHGFIGTAVPLIRGRHLLDTAEWAQWQRCIDNTVRRCVTIEGEFANWRPRLYTAPDEAGAMLMQFCHGAPGFVIALADHPTDALDDLLIAGGEATWQAGPLTKGSNLCHGTGGNGYAFLKLYRRTGDAKWLDRARAFAMHAIRQTEADAAQYAAMRYSLWTGDLGFAIYLWDCINGAARFPTLDVFFAN